jgi:hypothetical protein
MKRGKVKEEIYRKHFDGDMCEIRRSDFPDEILSDDIINIERDEGYYSDNNSWDASTRITIHRERPKTDEEVEEFKKAIDEMKEKSRQERYNSYLKLKDEFENKVKT